MFFYLIGKRRHSCLGVIKGTQSNLLNFELSKGTDRFD